MQPESKHEAIPAIQATQATQATQASRSQPEAFASRPSQDVSRPSQADVQGGFLPERKVAVMATSVWDTGDNDDRIAEHIKELLFDPRQKQKAGCGVFWGKKALLMPEANLCPHHLTPLKHSNTLKVLVHLFYRFVTLPKA